MLHWKLYMLPRQLLMKVLCICKSVHGKVAYAYTHLSFIQWILHEICMVSFSFFFFFLPLNSEIHRSARMLNTKSVKVHDSLWQNSYWVWTKFIWCNSKRMSEVHRWGCWLHSLQEVGETTGALLRPLCTDQQRCYPDTQSDSASAKSWASLLSWESDQMSRAKVEKQFNYCLQILL